MDASLDLSHFWTPELQASIDEYPQYMDSDNPWSEADVCDEFLNYEGEPSVPRGFAAFANKPNAFASPAFVNNAHPPLNSFAQPNFTPAPVASADFSAAASTGPSDTSLFLADTKNFFDSLIEKQDLAKTNLLQHPILPDTRRHPQQDVGQVTPFDGKRKRSLSSSVSTPAGKKASKASSSTKTPKSSSVGPTKKSAPRKNNKASPVSGSKQHAPAGRGNTTPTGSRTTAQAINIANDGDGDECIFVGSSQPLPSSSSGSAIGSSPATSSAVSSSPVGSSRNIVSSAPPTPPRKPCLDAIYDHLGTIHPYPLTQQGSFHLSRASVDKPYLPYTPGWIPAVLNQKVSDGLLNMTTLAEQDRRLKWALVCFQMKNQEGFGEGRWFNLGTWYDGSFGKSRAEYARTAKVLGWKVADRFMEWEYCYAVEEKKKRGRKPKVKVAGGQ